MIKRIILIMTAFLLIFSAAYASGDLTVTGNISSNGNIWSNNGSNGLPTYLTGQGLYSNGNTFIEPGAGKNLYIQPRYNPVYTCYSPYGPYYCPPQTTLQVNVNTSVFYGKVGIGVSSPAYTLQVNGSFSANSKYFDIMDPRYDDEQKRLVHSTLEGPEIGVYYRGVVMLAGGHGSVKLPEYFETLTRKENRTVLLTPKFKNDKETICNVAASDVIDGSFYISAFGTQDLSVCKHAVYWEVKAERADVEKIKVEQSRDDKPIKESGFIQHDKADSNGNNNGNSNTSNGNGTNK